MRRVCPRLSLLLLVIVAGLSGCDGGPRAAPATQSSANSGIRAQPAQSSRETLLSQWAAGRFDRLRDRATILRMLRDRAGIEFRTTLEPQALDALYVKLADLLWTWASADPESYLRFRPAWELAGPDDSRVAGRLAKLKESWPFPDRPPPADGAALYRFMWATYLNGRPAIEEVNWDTARIVVRSLASDQVVPVEWDEQAGIASHFFKERKRRYRHFGPSVLKLAIPNRVAVEQIAKRDRRITFADFRVIQRAAGRPASPLEVRFVYDPKQRSWLALHALVVVPGGTPLIW